MRRARYLHVRTLVVLLGMLLWVWTPACSDDGGAGPGLDLSTDGGPDARSDGRTDAQGDIKGGPDQSSGGAHKSKVDDLIKPILDGQWTVGLMVGLIGPSGKEVYAFGKTSATGTSPDADTLFEIGSITKTFTSLLLSDMVLQGKVTLTQPVQALLPAAKVTVPTYSGAAISLQHLSTHTSGLPRMPTNIAPKDLQNPYVDYTAADLYTFLNGYSLPRAPGAQWEYSNLAVGLLGHALALKAGKAFGALLADSITTPLKMTDTAMALTTAQAKRFAQGHDGDLTAAKAWDFDVLAPCGALRSTATDMLAYLAAQAGLTSSVLDAAMAASHKSQYKGVVEMGLGWLLSDSRYIWHNGGTYGFETFAGFDTKTRTGVVVLSNTFSMWSPQTKLGLALLKMMAGESYSAIDIPATVKVPTATLDLYTGTYKAGTSQFTISRTGDSLYIAIPGQSTYRLYAQTTEKFYLRVSQQGITFIKDSAGKYSSLEYSTTSGKGTYTKVP